MSAEAPDRTGQTWCRHSINAKRFIFIVLGPPVKHDQFEWRHPILVLRSDNRPDMEGRQSTSAEPKLRADPDHADSDLWSVPWEDMPSMTRIA